jgi:outer membrane protein assembly factor BamB
MEEFAMHPSRLFVLTAVFLVSSAFAADWPQWGGTPARNMVSEEKGLPESFVPGEKDAQSGGVKMETTKNVKWATKIGSNTLSSPVIVNGKVFLGTSDEKQGVFKCLDEKTGKLLWQYTAPHRQVPRKIDGDWPYNFAIFAPTLGICSTPAVEGDRVYFVNHRCEVVCLDIDGKPVWLHDMWELGVRPSDGCDGSPLIDGDFVYVCTSNGVDREVRVPYADNRKTPAPDAPNLIVLDKKTGRLLATDDAKHIGPNMLHGQWSSPSMGIVNGKKLIFFGGGDGVCYAFEALGGSGFRVQGSGKDPNSLNPEPRTLNPSRLQTAWSFDCNPPEYKNFGNMDWATHYSLGDRRLKTSINKIQDGSFVGMSEIIGTPVFYKNRVYVAIGRDPEHGRARGALWCIDAAKTGDITQSGCVWSYKGLDRTLSTASIADGLIYMSDVAGRLHCLDAETGKVYWVFASGGEVWGSTLVADGKIYFPTSKSLHVLAAGKELKELAKINLGAPMRATPVVANGTLYINSTRYLWAVR